MTEEEWLACAAPKSMLEFLQGRVSELQLVHFCWECVRVLENVPQETWRWERLEGLQLRSDREFLPTFNQVNENIKRHFVDMMDFATAARMRDIADALLERARLDWAATFRVEASQAVREIFGNPFRPATIDPRWLTSTVIDLADVIFSECVFDRMPILADALMDAGCDDEQIIAHCRNEGLHVRGCWVVDLLLEKE